MADVSTARAGLRPKGAASTRGGVLTERDQEWLRWIGRWRAVTAEQVARWFVPELSSGVKVVERRARVWRELGLVETRRILATTPAVHTLRGPAMTLFGISGPVRHPLVGQLSHDLAVVDLAIWLRQRDRSLKFLTEREIRATDDPNTDTPLLAVKAAEGSGRKLVFPDLISITVRADGSGAATAHEVELTSKDHPRMVALMTSYVVSEGIVAAHYYAAPPLRRRITKAAAEVNGWAKSAGAVGVPITVSGWDWLTPEGQSTRTGVEE
ncbi:hypothetical protein [Intrasporangium sp.]|uniref:hypothetical protein n=1 Tax=Intrasporangium sp. TaxID=1925024 RepID=UPI00264A1044|nr:hypothetical protein [Intrasporangium sp.]